MTLAEVITPFLAAGFAPEPHEPHFETVLSGVTYLRRGHAYVSLVSYENRFVETVWEVYLAPKNTRRPKGPDTKEKDANGKEAKYSDHQLRGFVPIETRLLRTREDLEGAHPLHLPAPAHQRARGTKSLLDMGPHSVETGMT